MQVKKGSSVGTAIAKTGAFKDGPGCEREETCDAEEIKETKPSNPHAVGPLLTRLRRFRCNLPPIDPLPVPFVQ